MRSSPTLLLAALITLPAVSAARAAPSLSLSLQTIRTVTQDGVQKEVFAPAEQVRPGDLLLQTARPVTDKAMKTATITVPVPTNMTYVAGSASGLHPLFSADGKIFSARPTRTVTVTENGRAVQKVVDVPQNEYRSVRWLLTDLKSGAQTPLSFRVTVN